MLIDKFLEQAIEVEVDAISDGKDVLVPSVMEHIEFAGIHSGDSACVIPPRSISNEHIEIIKSYTQKIAGAINVVGLMNIQYAIADGKVYILEANPRASRTVPLVSKVMNISMAKIATKILLGKKLKDVMPKEPGKISHVGVKEAVFPFNSYHGVDPVLGPEMKSTGEVLGIASSFGMAFYKSQEAAGGKLPESGSVFISVTDNDKNLILEPAKKLKEMGFKIITTKGTHDYLKEKGVDSDQTLKMHEGRPNIADEIRSKKIDMIINTPAGRESKYDDSYIRKAAIKYKIPYITTIAAAKAAVEGILAIKSGGIEIKALQDYHA
jgi:carbamoyl-phosphate synthase large subunit